MTKSEIKKFTTWTKTVSMMRVNINNVPSEYKELVEIYQNHRNNDENDTICYQCHHNAMCRVYSHIKRHQPKINNCPKCGGTGEIRAYKHIMNGVCFSCKGRKTI